MSTQILNPSPTLTNIRPSDKKIRLIAIIRDLGRGDLLWEPECDLYRNGEFYWRLPMCAIDAPTLSQPPQHHLIDYLLNSWGLLIEIKDTLIDDSSRSDIRDIYFNCLQMNRDNHIRPNKALPDLKYLSLLSGERMHLRHIYIAALLDRFSLFNGMMIANMNRLAPQEHMEFDLDRCLEDIPAAQECPFCFTPMQKEYYEYKNVIRGVDIHVYHVPGYGCISCPAKHGDQMVVSYLLNEISSRLGSTGTTTSLPHAR